MSEYDFHQLSPHDLETLTRDLLQAHWQITIESFKSGKDGGIDLRYAAGSNRTIVQVKHLLKTGFPELQRKLKTEAAKVRRLNPKRYVLATSVPLSAHNKDTIVAQIGADILQPDDVLGCEDLNNLLAQYPAIEGQHYKLWLASRAVLDRVIHNAAVTGSEFKAQKTYQDARRYVQSSAYPQALEMLKDHRIVIISGPPGVGKSTLANLLLYEHLENGYQAIVIQRDIDEGQSLFQNGVRQVFYFDDFMGATFLGDRTGALGGTNDRALLDFIAMVRATPASRLILTTREHIYAQAMDRSERLRDSELDDLRVFLHMPSYSFGQRARILYNHVYFSDLPPEYQEELLRNRFYLRIIKHKKFNPRLIEWLSSFRRLRNVPHPCYRTFVENLLKDPSEIWRHAYEQELTDAGRSILLAIFSLGGKTTSSILKTAFSVLHRKRAERYTFRTQPEDFHFALRELAGSFIRPHGAHGIEVIDPSVLDLLNAVIRTAPDNAVDIVSGAASFDQVERVWSFAKSDKGQAILETMRQNVDKLVDAVHVRMVDNRRITYHDGTTVYRGLTFERRLATVVEISERLRSYRFAALAGPLFERLLSEWQTERPEVVDAAELLRVLEGTQYIPSKRMLEMRTIVEQSVFDEVRSGCGSDELRELIGVIDISDPENGRSVEALCSAFIQYEQSIFLDELQECRSLEQFERLTEDLEFVRDQLKVDVTSLLASVEEGREEFTEQEELYADQMQDEWKERWRDERADERAVIEMFRSLR